MCKATIELSMIVKNGGSVLATCLRSARGVVDRIAIGDTGSTDGTREVARRFGAEWMSIPWNGDFAEARNRVLQHAVCDWILVLDADEMLDAGGADALVRVVRETDRFAFDVVRWNYVRDTNSRSGADGALANPGLLAEADGFPAYVTSLNTRLFRRHPGVWFERPVHETVVDRVKHLGLPIGQAPFVIHHFGHVEDDEAAREAKNELYLEIGRRHLAASPNDSRTAYEVGWGELEHAKNPGAALATLIRTIGLDESNTDAIILGGVCLLQLGRYGDAIELLLHAAGRNAKSIVLYETLGDAYLHRREYGPAADAYRTALRQGGAAALIVAKYGVCQIHSGEPREGMEALRRAYAMEPEHGNLLDIVIAGAVAAREASFAAELAGRRAEMAGASYLHRAIAEELREMVS